MAFQVGDYVQLSASGRERMRDVVACSGTQIGVGGAIDTQLAPFLQKINPDPYNNAVGSGYGFWYYSGFSCTGGTHDSIIVQKFEQTGKGNFATACSPTAPSPFTTDSYIVFID